VVGPLKNRYTRTGVLCVLGILRDIDAWCARRGININILESNVRQLATHLALGPHDLNAGLSH
jgi:hypothetical protein